VNTRLLATLFRRATVVALTPGSNVSATIRIFSSSDQRRRRSAPSRTLTRIDQVTLELDLRSQPPEAAVSPQGGSRRMRTSSVRLRFWECFLAGPVANAALAGDIAEVDRHAHALLAGADHLPKGMVHLVGTGPGDPELLTLCALRLIQSADVNRDRLVSDAGAGFRARRRRALL